MQFHWHHDEITKMPDGARVLAASERCQNQAWSHGLRTYGFQYHPEVYADTPEAWAGQHPDDVAKAGATIDELKARTAEAFVLRTGSLGESDVLITLFTRELGKVRGVARGARRSRKRFGGALEPLTRVRASFVEREGRDLVQVNDLEVLQLAC